jgi:ABC-type glycerol-3-phosphate transport system permease component
MRQAIETIPNDYIDAARIDGCSELRIFWWVILPSVKPAMATLLIIKFMWSWNEFSADGGDQQPPDEGGHHGSDEFHQYVLHRIQLLTAAAVISILPILLIFVTLQRWVVQAVVMSGLKG